MKNQVFYVVVRQEFYHANSFHYQKSEDQPVLDILFTQSDACKLCDMIAQHRFTYLADRYGDDHVKLYTQLHPSCEIAYKVGVLLDDIPEVVYNVQIIRL